MMSMQVDPFAPPSRALEAPLRRQARIIIITIIIIIIIIIKHNVANTIGFSSIVFGHVGKLIILAALSWADTTTMTKLETRRHLRPGVPRRYVA